MEPIDLGIAGAWRIRNTVHGDARGYFTEWFRADVATALLGRQWHTAQANVSRSARGVVRGVHYALVPPGQAKWVTCVDGGIIDFIVDIRPDSPTFGEHRRVELAAGSGDAVLISESLGHAFVATSEHATVSYLVNQPYAPTRELGVHPLDPDLGLDFRGIDVILSEKDRAALRLVEARERGLLPTLAEYRALDA